MLKPVRRVLLVSRIARRARRSQDRLSVTTVVVLWKNVNLEDNTCVHCIGMSLVTSDLFRLTRTRIGLCWLVGGR